MSKLNKKEILKDLKKPRAIIPNILSVSRIAAPFVIPPLAMTGNIPLVLLAASGFLLTDFLDGKIARAFNGQTKLGQLLDQISDKVCSIGLLLALIPTIPLMIAPLLLESTIAVINIKNTKKGINVKSAQSGRIKMWPLSISLISGYGMLLSSSPIFEIITYLGILTTAILEVVNIKEYYKLSKQQYNEERTKTIKPITNPQNQKTKIKTNQKQKDITYAEITEYIEQCPNISELTEIKEIISPTSETKPKEKIKQKKR